MGGMDRLLRLEDLQLVQVQAGVGAVLSAVSKAQPPALFEYMGKEGRRGHQALQIQNIPIFHSWKVQSDVVVKIFRRGSCAVSGFLTCRRMGAAHVYSEGNHKLKSLLCLGPRSCSSELGIHQRMSVCKAK